MIKVDASELLRTATRLRGARPRVERAIADGLREGGDKVRTEVRRALVQQTGVKRYGSITERTPVYFDRGGLQYMIKGSKKPIPIEDVRVSSKGRKRFGDWRDQPRTSRGLFGRIKDRLAGTVVAAPWNVAHRFKRSFFIMGKGMRAYRPGKKRETGPARRLYGPSVFYELVKGQSVATFHRAVPTHVSAAILKRIGKALGSV